MESRGKEPRESCSSTWLAVLGFMVMGFVSSTVSGQSSFLAHGPSLTQGLGGACVSMDGFQHKGFRENW